jgi:hypothetical protein
MTTDVSSRNTTPRGSSFPNRHKIGELDSSGFSLFVVGVTASEWVEVPSATHVDTSEECPSGQSGTRKRLEFEAVWNARLSAGLNPGIDPFSWDPGWSLGKTKKMASKKYECIIDCCCPSGQDEPNATVTCKELKSWLNHSHPLYDSFDIDHDGWPNDEPTPQHDPPTIGPAR